MKRADTAPRRAARGFNSRSYRVINCITEPREPNILCLLCCPCQTYAAAKGPRSQTTITDFFMRAGQSSTRHDVLAPRVVCISFPPLLASASAALSAPLGCVTAELRNIQSLINIGEALVRSGRGVTTTATLAL